MLCKSPPSSKFVYTYLLKRVCMWSSKSRPTLDAIIRVVQINGHVEHLHDPITVSHLIGDPPRYVVCTPLQLLSAGFIPMKDDTPLQPGHVYFLLPYSALKSDVSPLDLSALVKKLMARAKEKGSGRMPDALTPTSRLEGGCRKGQQQRSWKPLLDTIREKSFHNRSQSDLQEDHVPYF